MNHDDNLTPKQAAFVVLLMAEARDISNPELRDRYRLQIKASERKKLNELGYVETDTSQRAHVHRLTDAGWARCYRPLDLESPRARAQGAALGALLDAVRRHLERADLSLAEFAAGTGPVPSTETDPDPSPNASSNGVRTISPATNGPVRDRIRTAYGVLANVPGDWVGFARLRAALADVARDELDDALRTLARDEDVFIVPESNQKALTDADREAALWIGGQHKHAISMGSR